MISITHVKSYCCEDISNIENYNIAMSSPDKYDCHHRFETICPAFKFLVRDLKDFGLYYHRPASELIFLSKSEHMKLHSLDGVKVDRSVPFEHNYFHTHKFIGEENGFYGKHHSEETKKKCGAAMRGKHHKDDIKSQISKTTKLKISKVSASYKEYKLNGGTMKWNEFQKYYKEENK